MGRAHPALKRWAVLDCPSGTQPGFTKSLPKLYRILPVFIFSDLPVEDGLEVFVAGDVARGGGEAEVADLATLNSCCGLHWIRVGLDTLSSVAMRS